MEKFWLYVAAVVLAGFGAIYQYVKGKLRQIKVSHMITGPGAWPLIGNANLLFGKDCEEILDLIQNLMERYWCSYKFWIGPKLMVVVNTPADFQIVMNSSNCLEKPLQYGFFRCKNGLITAKAETWKVHRKLLNPTFNIKVLQTFIPIFNDKAAIMVERFKKHLHEESFDAFKPVGCCTLDMILATTLGVDMNIQQSGEGEKHVENIEALAEALNYRIFNVWLYPSFIHRLTKQYRHESLLFKRFNQLSTEVIRAKKAELARNPNHLSSNNNIDVGAEDDEKRPPLIYVDQLFQLARENGKMFNEKVIQDEIDTILIGGYETTALTTSFVLLMLAIHPEIQDKVIEEMRTIFQSQDEYVDYEKISKLTYLEMVIKETMRMFPNLSYIARETTEDLKLTYGVAPKGSILLLNIYGLHRNECAWEEPLVFDPQNFTSANIALRHPYSYMPFSWGARNCIGFRYGWLSMKVMLSHLLRNYKFSTHLKLEDLQPILQVTLKIKNKHMIRIEPRPFP